MAISDMPTGSRRIGGWILSFDATPAAWHFRWRLVAGACTLIAADDDAPEAVRAAARALLAVDAGGLEATQAPEVGGAEVWAGHQAERDVFDGDEDAASLCLSDDLE
jgi:hypothetical protein